MRKRESGSVLLIAMWALLLLSAAVMAWLGFIDRQIDFAHDRNHGLDARALAYSGLNVALHSQVTPEQPLLRREFGPGMRYEVRMTGEGGKLNLNWLLAGEDPARIALLKAYLERLGLDFREREALVDSLLDWVDADDVRRLNGLEQAPDYEAANRPLQSVDEVREVAGSGPLVAIPDWEKEFTVLSRGPVDLLAADEAVLAVVPGIGDLRAGQFLTYRRGADGTDYTEDDPKFENLEQLRSVLGFGTEQFKALQPLVTMSDPTWRIESVGEAAKVYRQLEVVARKRGAKAQILSWKEF